MSAGIHAEQRAEIAARVLYTPADVWTAHHEWAANCAPAAVAALAGKPLADVRHAFPWFPDRPWTNPSQLVQAWLAVYPRSFANRTVPNRHAEPSACFPRFGLAVIQIDGPWCRPEVDPRAAYRHTHTVASMGIRGALFVYDINAGSDAEPGGWTRFDSLHAAQSSPTWPDVMSDLVAQTKRGTGWFVKVCIEVGAPLPAGEVQP